MKPNELLPKNAICLNASGQAAQLLSSDLAQLPFECAHGATHGTSLGWRWGEAIACVEPFSGAAVVYFGLTCSVAARGRWQTFYLFLFLLSFFLAAAAPVANLPVEMDPRVETTAVASVCGFRSGFFLELLGAPAAAANKLTVKRNERETKTQKQGTIKVLSSKMAACGEAKELKQLFGERLEGYILYILPYLCMYFACLHSDKYVQ